MIKYSINNLIRSCDQPDLYLHTHPRMVSYLLNRIISFCQTSKQVSFGLDFGRMDNGGGGGNKTVILYSFCIVILWDAVI